MGEGRTRVEEALSSDIAVDDALTQPTTLKMLEEAGPITRLRSGVVSIVAALQQQQQEQ